MQEVAGMDGQASAQVAFSFDGVEMRGWEGDNLAATLMRAGQRHLRKSPRLGLPRGAFCLIGSCQECLVWANGVRGPACQMSVRAGMTVRSGALAG